MSPLQVPRLVWDVKWRDPESEVGGDFSFMAGGGGGGGGLLKDVCKIDEITLNYYQIDFCV